MTDTRTFTVPDHLERAVSELVRALQGLTDDQFHELTGRLRGRLDISAGHLVTGEGVVWDDPVDGVEWALDSLRVAEQNHRIDVVQAMEADLAGGHLVAVGIGNEVDKFAAICDPNPPGKFCWEGPDRDTVEEATEDGRAHHPGREPELWGRLQDD